MIKIKRLTLASSGGALTIVKISDTCGRLGAEFG
jgi:hypothetical protein